MALQDLTPQLRTRLNRLERAVGWFVLVALALMIVGFVYYLRNTAQRRGWFLQKITYQTCVASGAGLKVGNPVKLMGFDVGEITAIIPNQPDAYYNITVRFQIKVNQDNYPGYIWSDSKVKVNAGDLLGGRFLEVTKGTAGLPTVRETTNHTVIGVLRGRFVEELRKERMAELKSADLAAVEKGQHPQRSDDELLAQVWEELSAKANEHPATYYTNLGPENIYFLTPVESPAVTERLERVVNNVEQALPNILRLTNRIASVLDHSATLASNLNLVALDARPAASNLARLATELRGPGALGQWALGSNGQQKLEATLANANTVLIHADTNLLALAESLAASLDSLAGITSNLNAQVQANTNILGSISRAVIDTDELVQGLKKHWFLRSAFRDSKQQPSPAPETPVSPVLSPKAREQR